jgi:DNA invertase Pin-like site-specific DNA recombinase
MKMAVIYVRVSSEEQVKNLSLDTQEKICREYCERNGMEVDRVFVEKGESAKTTDRTEFQAMLAYCQQNKKHLRFVVVYTVNRFARNNEDHFAVAGFLRRLGISLRSATEPIDESPAGAFVESMLAAVAALDNAMRQQNTVNGMKAALRIGRWPFQVPLGYRKVKDANGKTVVALDKARAAQIKQAFEMFATARYTKKEVYRHLLQLGFRTVKGNKVPYNTFEWILANPFCAGQVVVKKWGEPQRGTHEPLVSQELFDAVQAILLGRKPAVTAYQRNHPDFPLRGFAKCGACGHAITGSWAKGRQQKYPYYHCSKRCRGVNVRKEVLEARFLEHLQQLQAKPEVAVLFREIVLDVWNSKQAETISLAAAQQRQLTTLEERKQRLLDAYVYDKAIDRETFQQQTAKLEEELAMARQALREAKDDGFDFKAVAAFAEQVLTDPAKLWLEMPLDQRQRLQKVLFPGGIHLTANGEIRTAGTCCIYDSLQMDGAPETSVVRHIATSWNRIIAWLREIEQIRQAARNGLATA